MYAIVEIAGHQYKVEKDQRIFVNRLEGKEGSKITFDNVLLIEDKGKITVGAPAIKGAKVSAKVESHLKGDKVIVFKKKRRKGYKVKNGHRQFLTQLTIGAITKKSPTKSPSKPAEKPASKAAPKTEAKNKLT
jgi:large subunit ribosomal protein L21